MKTIIFSSAIMLALLISPVFGQKFSNINPNTKAGINHVSNFIIHHPKAENLVKDKSPLIANTMKSIPKSHNVINTPEWLLDQKTIKHPGGNDAIMMVSRKNTINQTK